MPMNVGAQPRPLPGGFPGGPGSGLPGKPAGWGPSANADAWFPPGPGAHHVGTDAYECWGAAAATTWWLPRRPWIGASRETRWVGPFRRSRCGRMLRSRRELHWYAPNCWR